MGKRLEKKSKNEKQTTCEVKIVEKYKLSNYR